MIGYVARTDRYGQTQNIGQATEVNLYALKRIAEDTTLNTKTIVEEFIHEKYGKETVDILTPVFMETDDILLSVFYTLGLNMTSHSRFELDYPSIYGRHCSGKWLKNPVISVGHGINETFHYWKDVVEHLSPARYKTKKTKDGEMTVLYQEAPWVIDNMWLSPEDKMNEKYLEYIITEKEYGVKKALWAVNEIKKVQSLVSDQSEYQELLQLYERTYLTSKLYLAGAKAYFGFRTYLNDTTNAKVKTIANEGLTSIEEITNEMHNYQHKGPTGGQFQWIDDTIRASDLYNKIKNGWNVYGSQKLNDSSGFNVEQDGES